MRASSFFMKTFVCSLALMVISISSLSAQDYSFTPKDLSDVEKLYGLSLYWKEASYNFAFFDQVPDLDWDAAYQEYIPKVLATNSLKEYYRVMQRFSALLNDGHTWINPPRELRSEKYYDYAPMRLASLGHRAIVVNVDSAFVSEVPIGSEIIAVDGKPTEQYLIDDVLPWVNDSTEHKRWDRAIVGLSTFNYGLLYGEPLEEVTYRMLTPSGEEQDVKMTRNTRAQRANGTLQWAKPEQEDALLEHRWLEDDILYVSLNSFREFELLDQFKEEVLPELPKAKAVIIDLRRNAGGKDPVGMGILDYFVDEPLEGAGWKTTQHIAAFKAWAATDPEGQYAPYLKGDVWYEGGHHQFKPTDGPKFLVPVVVLSGYDTGSAAENFLLITVDHDRFTTVGEPSIGSTGQPLFLKLPGGGSAAICAKRNTYHDGREFIGYGIEPEVRVERTLPYLLGKEDPFIDKGIEVLKRMMAGQKFNAK